MPEPAHPHHQHSPSFLAPLMEQANKQLEAEPQQRMLARIPKSPATSADRDSLLRPSLSPAGRSLIGRTVLERKTTAFALIGGGLILCAAASAKLAQTAGMLSPNQLTMTLLASAALTVVFAIAVGITAARGTSATDGPFWVLPGRTSFFVAPHSRRESVLSGEEALLAEHSAAALWSLYGGKQSTTWRSKPLSQWRSHLDLRDEAAQTIRFAGDLQELRESLEERPQSERAKAAWRDDHTVYSAGLAALRERVQRQMALRLAVEKTSMPAQDRQGLAARIATELPAQEQAIDHLATIGVSPSVPAQASDPEAATPPR